MNRRDVLVLATFFEVGCAAILLSCFVVIVGVIGAPWSHAVLYLSPVWLIMLIILGFAVSARER